MFKQPNCVVARQGLLLFRNCEHPDTTNKTKTPKESGVVHSMDPPVVGRDWAHLSSKNICGAAVELQASIESNGNRGVQAAAAGSPAVFAHTGHSVGLRSGGPEPIDRWVSSC
jgi:hypothetical protein